MTQSVTPFGLPRKGPQELRRDPAQVLRECLSARNLGIQDIADVWGVSRTVTARILNGERPISWQRLRSLPRPVLADWCRRFGASVEGAPCRSVEGEHMDVVVELGRVTDELRAALADGRVDDDERAALRERVARLASEVADLQRSVA